MELRAYASILSRRWLAIVMLPLAVLVMIALFEQSRQTNYTAQARISVEQTFRRTAISTVSVR